MAASPQQSSAAETNGRTSLLSIIDPEKIANGRTDTTETNTTDEEAAAAGVESALRAPPERQRWNESGTNIYRFLSTIYSFILLGMSDAVIGALIPYVC